MEKILDEFSGVRGMSDIIRYHKKNNPEAIKQLINEILPNVENKVKTSKNPLVLKSLGIANQVRGGGKLDEWSDAQIFAVVFFGLLFGTITIGGLLYGLNYLYLRRRIPYHRREIRRQMREMERARQIREAEDLRRAGEYSEKYGSFPRNQDGFDSWIETREKLYEKQKRGENPKSLSIEEIREAIEYFNVDMEYRPSPDDFVRGKVSERMKKWINDFQKNNSRMPTKEEIDKQLRIFNSHFGIRV